MKIITFNDVVNLGLTNKECYSFVEEALSIKSESLLPAKISIKPYSDVFYNTMPVLIPKIQRGGVKIVTRYPNRVPSLQAQILLYDLESGDNIALVDGTWITAMRTGAIAAHSIKQFAIKDFSVIGMIGLGNTARATLSILLDLYPNREFHIKLKKYKNQHIVFANDFALYSNVNFSYCDVYDETVRECDVVISCATYFDTNICSDDCFKEGVCLVPVHTRGFGNCDLFFDKVYADDEKHVNSFKYFNQFKKFAEVSDVISGKVKGRETNKERILVYNVGIALHDIYFASRIYDLCDNCNDVSMTVFPNKHWL